VSSNAFSAKDNKPEQKAYKAYRYNDNTFQNNIRDGG